MKIDLNEPWVLPVLAIAVTLISGWTLLNSETEALEKTVTEHEEKVNTLMTDIEVIKERIANIDETLKIMRDDHAKIHKVYENALGVLAELEREWAGQRVPQYVPQRQYIPGSQPIQ